MGVVKVIAWTVLIGAGIGIITTAATTKTPPKTEPTGSIPVWDTIDLGKQISVDVTWRTFAERPVAHMSFSMAHNGKQAVKDLKLSCRFIAQSGTVVAERKATIYRIVRPGDRVSATVNMGLVPQARRVSCKVASAQAVE